jgi:transposase InsO family protein
MAWFRRRPASGLISNSDRSSQYASGDFQKQLSIFGIALGDAKRGQGQFDKNATIHLQNSQRLRNQY